jgi:hypothetical protein
MANCTIPIRDRIQPPQYDDTGDRDIHRVLKDLLSKEEGKAKNGDQYTFLGVADRCFVVAIADVFLDTCQSYRPNQRQYSSRGCNDVGNDNDTTIGLALMAVIAAVMVTAANGILHRQERNDGPW